jgi:predicted HD phosphohydrolase
VGEVLQYGNVDVKGEDTNGGIASKFIAAEILHDVGDMYWADGTVESAAELALAGQIGTRFVSAAGIN